MCLFLYCKSVFIYHSICIRLADATALSEGTYLANNTQVDFVNRSIDLVNRSINPDFGVFDGEPSSSSDSDTDCSQISSIIR